MTDYLTSPALSRLLGRDRRETAAIIGKLEALGYALTPDGRGSRLVPPALAEVTKKALALGYGLEHLRGNHDLDVYLREPKSAELDALEPLITVAAELAIIREAVGALAASARWAKVPLEPDWGVLGLPAPRSGL